MKIVFTVIAICLLMSSQSLMAEDTAQSTNFMKQTPSSEQLVEALKEPAQQFTYRSIKVKPVQSKVLLNITFEFNSDELTPKAKQTLTELGKALSSAELKDNAFVVEGHTDGTGNEDYNQTLSEKRAFAVSTYLAKQHSVDPTRLQPVGKGETELFDAINAESADNRRVEVINTGKKVR